MICVFCLGNCHLTANIRKLKKIHGGKPHIISIDNTITIEKAIAPMIAVIINSPCFLQICKVVSIL